VNAAAAEYDLIRRLVRGFPRPDAQRNSLGESDAELLTLPDGSILAVTTDSISEEIATGLYDPFLAGWMAVTVSCSDLAAVGARPLALLLSETLDRSWNEDQVAVLQRGIAQAARSCGIGIAGGDTNSGDRTALTGTALGICEDGRPLTRTGIQDGDLLYISSSAGTGSAFAASILFDRRDALSSSPMHANDRHPWQPVAALEEGILLRDFATACMDNSDGLLPTLDELMRINDCGFILDRDIAEYLHPMGQHAAALLTLPGWAMLCGPHGDYSLVFTVPARLGEAFEHAARAADWQPLRIGYASPTPQLCIRYCNELMPCDARALRNLVFTTTDPFEILRSLRALCDSKQHYEGVPS
jgi:thiamine-monophosphate kinase